MEYFENKKKIILSAFIIALALAGVFLSMYLIYRKNITRYLSQQTKTMNYVIPGVPYFGFYNLFFKAEDSSIHASVLEVLKYWDDKRYSADNLPSLLPNYFYTTGDLEKVFKDIGYETSSWPSVSSPKQEGGELSFIRNFVNDEKKVPVIISQRSTLNDLLMEDRIVIGISDQEKKVTVHDYYFGNNYEISFADFQKMFVTENGVSVLAVWPSERIKNETATPNSSASYPARIKNSDKMGELLIERKMAVREPDKNKKLALYERIILNADFKLFPAAVQIRLLAEGANVNIYAGNYDRAIDLINTTTRPIMESQKPNETVEGWYLASPDITPYLALTKAYVLKKNKPLALKAFGEVQKTYAELLKQGIISRYPVSQKKLENTINQRKEEIDQIR